MALWANAVFYHLALSDLSLHDGMSVLVSGIFVNDVGGSYPFYDSVYLLLRYAWSAEPCYGPAKVVPIDDYVVGCGDPQAGFLAEGYDGDDREVTDVGQQAFHGSGVCLVLANGIPETVLLTCPSVPFFLAQQALLPFF